MTTLRDPQAGLTDEEAARARQEAEEANAYVQVTETHVPTEDESDRATMAAAEAAAQPTPIAGIMTFANGVRLRLKPVSPLFLRRAQAQLRKPQPPLWENPNNGRQEYNEADPQYLEALAIYNEQVETAGIRALILAGTRLDFCPPEVPRPESQEWVDIALESGVVYEFKTEVGRYATWVEDVAFSNKEDFYDLGMAVGRLTGISEEDMARALDAFRGRSDGAAAGGADVPAVNLDRRDIPAADARAGAGD